MKFKKGSSGKKKEDMLRGAMESSGSNPEGNSGIMHDFINDIKKNHSSEEGTPRDYTTEETETEKNTQKDKNAIIEQISTTLSPLRSSRTAEWTISFTAFITVIAIFTWIVSLFFTEPAGPILTLSNEPIDYAIPHSGEELLKLDGDKDIYILFESHEKIGAPVVQINIYSLKGGMRTKTGSSQWEINPDWRRLETHFQEDYFPYSGEFEVTLQKRDGTVLASQKLLLR